MVNRTSAFTWVAEGRGTVTLLALPNRASMVTVRSAVMSSTGWVSIVIII
jgi:hypothetical protein